MLTDFRTGSVILLFLLVDSLPGFAQNPVEKRQAATCSFSEGFLENSGNMLTNMGRMESNSKENNAHTHSLQKHLVLRGLGTTTPGLSDLTTFNQI